MILITVYDLNFTVKFLDHKDFTVMGQILPMLVTYKFEYNKAMRRVIRVQDRMFYTIIDGHYHFSIGMLKDFIVTLKRYGFKEEDLQIEYKYIKDPYKINIKFNKKLIPRDYQIKYIEAVKESKYKINLIDLNTGYGKTFIAVKLASELGYRIGLVIIPRYIDKWIGDITNYTNIKKEEIYIIKGNENITNLKNIDVNKFKVFIFSLRTMTTYMKNYEDSVNNVSIIPDEINNLLKLGLLISDEAHQEFHALYKFCLYFNAKKMIALTATLTSNDNNVIKIQNIMFPPNSRISNIIDYEPYINVCSVRYEIDSMRGIKYLKPQGYNHILFENSVLENKALTKSYLDMIYYYVNLSYLRKRLPGNKCLIFASSVGMCETIVNDLNKRLHKEHLLIRKYTQEDPYEHVIDSDICVSTMLSSGTAIDIKGLITVVQTVCVNSNIANIQSLGRLRRIDNQDVNFYYLYCGNIDRHNKNNKLRASMLHKHAKRIEMSHYHEKLKTR